MKVLFLHGAIKNAGDFLIAHRSQLLIKKIIPEIEIIPVWEGEKTSTIEDNYSKGRWDYIWRWSLFYFQYISRRYSICVRY